MDVRYWEDERSFHAELARVSDGLLFRMIANELSKTFKVNWKGKIDGLDQRYWDFEYEGSELTLHLEHYLGISIYADKSKRDIDQAKEALAQIGDHFKTWTPN